MRPTGSLQILKPIGVSADPVHAGHGLRLRLALRADASVDRPELVLDQDQRLTRFAIPAGTQVIAEIEVPTTKPGRLPVGRFPLCTH